MDKQIPIVVQLQELASNSQTKVDELLRKALVVAAKLGLSDFRKWIEGELNGYGAGSTIPDYRRVRCQLKAFNPFQGLIPFRLPAEMHEEVCNSFVVQPVTEIQHLVETAEKSDVWPQVHLPPQAVRLLLEIQQSELPLEPVLQISPTQLTGILAAVRNKVLEWALGLENNGIIGDGYTFNDQER